MLNLYITSCRKREGKTFLTAGIAATMQSLGYKTSVYKPIQTSGIEFNGFTQSPDLTYIKTVDPYIETHFTYVFKDSAEPLVAAETEDKFIDLDTIYKDFQRISSSGECVLTDGDSGILSPLAKDVQTVDLIKKLQVPVLFTVTSNENSVNDILLSINSAEDKGIKVNGVVINKINDSADRTELTSLIRIIEEYSDTKVLGLVPNLGGKVMPEELITGILNGIDIESVFNVRIEKLDFGR